jgi:hypothetical protein
MIDQADGDSGLRADAALRQALMGMEFQACDRRFDERLAALLRRLALESGFARCHYGKYDGIRPRAAICVS